MKFRVSEAYRDTRFDDGTCLVRLTESTLGRVLHGHDGSGYVIISPCRAKENLEQELGRELTDQEAIDENNKRVRELKQDLIKLGYSYIHAYGGYHEEGTNEFSYEKSFIVYPFSRKGEQKDFEVFFKDMVDLGNKYNQDSILRKHPDEKAKYIVCKTGETDMEFDGITTNDITQEYFTALRQNDHKYNMDSVKRFTYEGLYVPKASSIMDGHRRYSMNELFVMK